jgi:8-oxo-dGTP diphosphatase
MLAKTSSPIFIVAALVQDDEGRVLLVRKRGTRAFMQPGGKLQNSESRLTALEREIREELTCSIEPSSAVFLGTFTAPAANEEGRLVEAALYGVKLIGTVQNSAEIEEAMWLHPDPPHAVDLAPLTRHKVLPLAAQLLGASTRKAFEP